MNDNVSIDYATTGPLRDYAKAALPEKKTKGWLNFGLGGLNKAFRYATGGGTTEGAGIAGAPLIGVGLVGLGLGALGYHTGPWLERKIRRMVSPKFGGDEDDDYETEEDREDARKFWMYGLGGAGALLTAALNADNTKPWYGFKHYPAMTKRANAWNDITLGQGMEMLSEAHMDPTVKAQSMLLLHSFNAPPATPITGNDLVGQAIATGQSAAAGMAVGYLTASVLGLPNPKSTAILGAVANVLGPKSALASSVVFGH